MNPELKFTERFWDVLKENLLSAVLLHWHYKIWTKTDDISCWSGSFSI